MKNFRYLFKEGFKGAWANRLMSLASIGVLVACMVVIGLAILISENVAMALGNLEKQNVVMVYMKDYTWALYSDNAVAEGQEADAERTITDADYIIHNEDEAKALCDKINDLPNVEDVKFVSGEEGLQSVKENMLGDQAEYFTFLDEEHGNPLSAAAKVTMSDMALFDQTIAEIQKLDGVDVIQSQGEVADKITAIKQGISVAGFWIIAILGVISLVIVSNTIRVTMYSRKLEISIMKAVGATNAFIRVPFVIEGMLIGIISALISEGLLYFCYRVATETIATTLGTADIIKYQDVALQLLAVFVGIGVLAGIIGSVFIINKYLRKEGSEFSAI